MGVLATFMVPHPPLIIPDVGRGGEAQIIETSRAYERVADEIADLQPETIIITSPHSVMYSDYFHISPGNAVMGSMSQFGANQVKFVEEYDTELVKEIEKSIFLRGLLEKLTEISIMERWFLFGL